MDFNYLQLSLTMQKPQLQHNCKVWQLDSNCCAVFTKVGHLKWFWYDRL